MAWSAGSGAAPLSARQAWYVISVSEEFKRHIGRYLRPGDSRFQVDSALFNNLLKFCVAVTRRGRRTGKVFADTSGCGAA